jgi:hypothetical protein
MIIGMAGETVCPSAREWPRFNRPAGTGSILFIVQALRVWLLSCCPSGTKIQPQSELAKDKLAMRNKISLKTSRPVDQRLLLIACRR